MDRRPELSLNEWTVLGLLVESPRHGYDLAAELAPDAPVGRAWALPRAAVYRAMARLEDLGHAEPRRREAGDAAPPRTIYGPTRKGRAALRRWLLEPVDHLREVRSTLLVKLLLAQRLGVDVAPLVAAQRERFDPVLSRRVEPDDPGDPVARWRRHAARAIDRFLDDLADDAR